MTAVKDKKEQGLKKMGKSKIAVDYLKYQVEQINERRLQFKEDLVVELNKQRQKAFRRAQLEEELEAMERQVASGKAPVKSFALKRAETITSDAKTARQQREKKQTETLEKEFLKGLDHIQDIKLAA